MYSTGDNILESSESGHRVTGLRCDWVAGYGYISFKDSVYRGFWYKDRFTDHRLTEFTFR